LKTTAGGHPRSIAREFSGACGDLGTFIPHAMGAMTLAGLAPAGVLFGFAAFLIGTGLFYALPLPVQPMKAVSAVILTDGLRPGEVAAAGLMLGLVLLVLGVTGWIGRLARMIPQSVSAGLQLGLGLLMGVLGTRLMLRTPWPGFGAPALLLLLSRIPRCPAAPITLAAAAIIGWAGAGAAIPHDTASCSRTRRKRPGIATRARRSCTIGAGTTRKRRRRFLRRLNFRSRLAGTIPKGAENSRAIVKILRLAL
jgi:Molybdate transporter of MFS superfamily